MGCRSSRRCGPARSEPGAGGSTGRAPGLREAFGWVALLGYCAEMGWGPAPQRGAGDHEKGLQPGDRLTASVMVLERIDSPRDLKALSRPEIDILSREIRAVLIDACAKNGGHLGPNLGVVELTLALHRVLDAPQDKIVWDVSHQVYVQKLLTGRRDRIHTI